MNEPRNRNSQHTGMRGGVDAWTPRGVTVHGLMALIGATLLLPLTAVAQETPSRPAIVSISRYAKWPVLAAAAGFTAVALSRNRDADQVYSALNAFCAQTQAACRVVSVGEVRRYQGDEPEALYQETLRLDRSARGWIIAGQVSLLAAGTMFLMDLIAGDDEPDNIPFQGMSVVADGRKLGLRVTF